MLWAGFALKFVRASFHVHCGKVGITVDMSATVLVGVLLRPELCARVINQDPEFLAGFQPQAVKPQPYSSRYVRGLFCALPRFADKGHGHPAKAW